MLVKGRKYVCEAIPPAFSHLFNIAMINSIGKPLACKVAGAHSSILSDGYSYHNAWLKAIDFEIKTNKQGHLKLDGVACRFDKLPPHANAVMLQTDTLYAFVESRQITSFAIYKSSANEKYHKRKMFEMTTPNYMIGRIMDSSLILEYEYRGKALFTRPYHTSNVNEYGNICLGGKEFHSLSELDYLFWRGPFHNDQCHFNNKIRHCCEQESTFHGCTNKKNQHNHGHGPNCRCCQNRCDCMKHKCKCACCLNKCQCVCDCNLTDKYIDLISNYKEAKPFVKFPTHEKLEIEDGVTHVCIVEDADFLKHLGKRESTIFPAKMIEGKYVAKFDEATIGVRSKE